MDWWKNNSVARFTVGACIALILIVCTGYALVAHTSNNQPQTPVGITTESTHLGTPATQVVKAAELAEIETYAKERLSFYAQDVHRPIRVDVIAPGQSTECTSHNIGPIRGEDLALKPVIWCYVYDGADHSFLVPYSAMQAARGALKPLELERAFLGAVAQARILARTGQFSVDEGEGLLEVGDILRQLVNSGQLSPEAACWLASFDSSAQEALGLSC